MMPTTNPLMCEVCRNEEAVGVACVPGVPYSAAYGRQCLQKDAHPYHIVRGYVECALTPETFDKWEDPEVLQQEYIDELNTYVDGAYITLREALRKYPIKKEDVTFDDLDGPEDDDAST